VTVLRSFAAGLLTLGLASGCQTAVNYLSVRCEVVLDELSPTEGYAGDPITVLGSPFTTHYDTAVYVGTSRATVSEVEREDCDACDECRGDEGCTACSDCDTCDLACAQTCNQWMLFEVPEVDPGEWDVQVFNAHGQSNTLTLLVAGSDDIQDTGDSADTSQTDSGSKDTAAKDTAEKDTAEKDTAKKDTAAKDTAAKDTAEKDTAEKDTAEKDTAEKDTAEKDTAEKDTAKK